ncbi:MAG: polyhydroxyalkanoate granule-associated phasin [Ramlibacter sp.]
MPLQIHPSLFNPAMLWADLAMKAAEMMVSSTEVIGNRVDQIARAGANPSPRDMREIALMSSEKVKAATESSLAVATRMQSQNMQIFARAWQQWLTSLGAMAALTTSRTFGEALARQNSLFNALSRSGRTHAQISSDAAQLAHAAIKPVHAASTANAKRLRGAKKTRSTRR